jgi:HD-GYP domain-containing protein (c-di-GMP phosphodiesterase class II)
MNINLSEKELLKLSLSALIHDLGKCKIPIDILMKKDKLLLSEVEFIKNHPQYGFDLIDDTIPLPIDKDTIIYHHERFDGKGYPNGLKGESIPYTARIINVADSFDAMTSKRPYKKKISQSEAIIELKNNENKQFDKYIVSSFLLGLKKERNVHFE